ncbi:MAG: hypothetical protein U0838_07665 [Chloroflexota bacterium]
MEDVRALTPVAVRQYAADTYEIELRDHAGQAQYVRVAVKWFGEFYGGVTDPPSRTGDVPSYDSIAIVNLAVAMHLAVHGQWHRPYPPNPLPVDSLDHRDQVPPEST